MSPPNPLTAIALVTGAFLVSWAGVGLFRSWSVRRKMLDIPNERSSHSQPTPRGGGLVIAAAGLLGYVATSWLFDTPFSTGYLIGAFLVAVVSWIDDLISLPFWLRLIVHITAAVVLINDLGPWQNFPLPFGTTDLPLGAFMGWLITVTWVVWILNAYNFMDGIDGIAGLQAVIAGVAWAILSISLGLPGTLIFSALLAAVSFGFLIHNWQPARIFMGDVGSAYLGFTLASLPLLARHEAKIDTPSLMLAAIAFVWLFVFDTVFTLVRRAIKGERVWEAHRSHLYQWMIIGGMSHQSVTLIYGLVSVAIATIVGLAIVFAGIYSVLSIFLLVLLTSLVVVLASWRKPLT